MVNILILPAAHVVKTEQDAEASVTQACEIFPGVLLSTLSWLAQPGDRTLHEAGSYGWRVTAPVTAPAVKGGKVTVRLESDDGLAVYGPRFGRLPFGPRVVR